MFRSLNCRRFLIPLLGARRGRLLILRPDGELTALPAALGAFVARHGVTRGILDFGSVQANAVPRSFLTWRARLPQILLGQERVIVAPQQEIYELAFYAAQPRDFGNSKDGLCACSPTRTWRSTLNNPTSTLC
jgi:hypothetical protein